MVKNTIIAKIAKQRGISSEAVEQEMLEAIRATYENPNATPEQIQARNKVPRKGDIPTLDEFICYIAGQVK